MDKALAQSNTLSMEIDELSRKKYIDSTIETLLEIEDEIFLLEKSGNLTSDTHKIMRTIHSIKGSSGAYYLDFASTICHNLEDVLTDILKGQNLTELVDLALRLHDLLVNFYRQAKQKDFVLEDFETKLHFLLVDSIGEKSADTKLGVRVMLVENSSVLVSKIRKDLNSLGVSVTFEDNALDAFTRLMRESFDLLITGHNTPEMLGENLIAAIRLEGGKSRKIKTCLITSDPQGLVIQENLRPHKVFKKDSELFNNVKTYVKRSFLIDHEEVKTKAKDLKSVLMIEDDPFIQQLVSSVFAKHPIKFEIANNGEEGLKRLESFVPDLILLDYYMPVKDGLSTLKDLKGNPVYANIPVLFFSGKTKPEEVKEILNLGAQGIVKKPFKVNNLFSEIINKWHLC